MNVKNWSVCLIEPNKFERQIFVDLLRNAGVEKIKAFADSDEAMETLELFSATIIIGAVEMTPTDGATWTRVFRRNTNAANRKAPVFLTSRAFLRSTAEECRHAGANALIGKPVSGKVLIATITKVLANPRPFVDAPGYVGPCRRAGIVTAGTGSRRRKSDDTARAAAPDPMAMVAALSNAVAALVQDRSSAETCQAALRPVHDHAVKTGDGPMARACEALSLQLTSKTQNDAGKAALTACVAGVAQLASIALGETERREAIAEAVRNEVAKAASRRAA